MCGILGEFGKKISPKFEFSKLLKLSSQRGSDMVGYYHDSSSSSKGKPLVQFGFNRLAIMDTRKIANQPMISNSKRYIVMCNGEITNFLILKKKMGLLSNDTKTNSDTEIICHALDCFGFERTLRSLNGMYALAVYDLRYHTIYLARDPAGIKPLYFAQTHSGWIFSSQYDQIFKHKWFSDSLEINKEALTDYFRLGYIPAPSAIFNNSWMLEPGSYVTINSDFNLSVHQYHSIDSKAKYRETHQSTLEILKDLFHNTFRDYIHSDVPLGSFLSGGIDSPVINAVLSKSHPNIKAFTIGTADTDFDESKKAKLISNHLGIQHHIECLTDTKVVNIIDKHFESFSEPFADYSSIPTYILCSEASKHFKVLISGDGGDELFWGYPRFLNTIDHKSWFSYPKNVRLKFAGLLRRFGMKISSGIELENIGEWVFERQSPNWSSAVGKIIPNSIHSFKTKDLYLSPKQNCSEVELLQWLKKNEFYGHLQRVLLKVDRASMAHGIEVRVPFLDQRIIDFSSSIIPELGIHHRQTKYLLKKVLNKYVPSEYYFSYKKGFSFNLNELLNHQLKENVQDTLLSKNLFGSEYIDEKFIHNQVNNYYDNTGLKNEWGIWVLFSLQKWAGIFHDK